MENYQPKLGQLATEADRRDAVHIAMAPVIASHNLLPGSRVKLDSNGEAMWTSIDPIGIVDPFLQEPVKQGDRFWLMLFPGTITGLRHTWSHPAFTPKMPTPKTEDQ